MNLFQCNAIVMTTVHVKLEAENKQDAANKAMKLIEEKGTLVLWDKEEGIWIGPEEHEIDEDIEVSMALDGPISFWDEVEMMTVET